MSSSPIRPQGPVNYSDAKSVTDSLKQSQSTGFQSLGKAVDAKYNDVLTAKPEDKFAKAAAFASQLLNAGNSEVSLHGDKGLTAEAKSQLKAAAGDALRGAGVSDEDIAGAVKSAFEPTQTTSYQNFPSLQNK